MMESGGICTFWIGTLSWLGNHDGSLVTCMLPMELTWEEVAPPHKWMTQWMAWAGVVFAIVKCLWYHDKSVEGRLYKWVIYLVFFFIIYLLSHFFDLRVTKTTTINRYVISFIFEFLAVWKKCLQFLAQSKNRIVVTIDNVQVVFIIEFVKHIARDKLNKIVFFYHPSNILSRLTVRLFEDNCTSHYNLWTLQFSRFVLCG